jgi:hypothetical protein
MKLLFMQRVETIKHGCITSHQMIWNMRCNLINWQDVPEALAPTASFFYQWFCRTQKQSVPLSPIFSSVNLDGSFDR